jgi:hypothetical protein
MHWRQVAKKVWPSKKISRMIREQDGNGELRLFARLEEELRAALH